MLHCAICSIHCTMRLSDLDERNVSVIESILEYCHNTPKKHFQHQHIFSAIRGKYSDLQRTEIRDFFNIMDELLDVGTYKSEQIRFYVDRIKIKAFLSNGGIRKFIESELSTNEQASEKSSLELESLRLQVTTLKRQNSQNRTTWIIAVIGWALTAILWLLSTLLSSEQPTEKSSNETNQLKKDVLEAATDTLNKPNLENPYDSIKR